jgi:hypothetical protein
VFATPLQQVLLKTTPTPLLVPPNLWDARHLHSIHVSTTIVSELSFKPRLFRGSRHFRLNGYTIYFKPLSAYQLPFYRFMRGGSAKDLPGQYRFFLHLPVCHHAAIRIMVIYLTLHNGLVLLVRPFLICVPDGGTLLSSRPRHLHVQLRPFWTRTSPYEDNIVVRRFFHRFAQSQRHTSASFGGYSSPQQPAPRPHCSSACRRHAATDDHDVAAPAAASALPSSSSGGKNRPEQMNE